VRSVLLLMWSMLYVSVRRLLRGPLLPSWTWELEVSTHFLKLQAEASFDIKDIEQGRLYERSLVFHSDAVEQVRITRVETAVLGDWYEADTGTAAVTMLYLHGGGYASYAGAYLNFIALTTLAARSRTFALDYPLIPEHTFPAQLDCAMAAYRWLLETGVEPGRLVVAGDSAGGNLALALLLALRDGGEALPALAICMGPWTDPSNPGDSMTTNARYDWVGKRMADRWSQWFVADDSLDNPLISPVKADLTGLPPIYIQAGGAEILLDMIVEFADRAAQQGAEVTLDVWPEMTHDFQAFGDMVPQSREALERIGEVVRQHTE
jgi:acetyl esterase/lipase